MSTGQSAPPGGAEGVRLTDVVGPGGVASPGAGRVVLLDVARGLFLVAMVATHALAFAGVRDTSPLAWVMPASDVWLGYRFVILTGLTIAWVYGARSDAASTRALRRRAVQVGVAAFASNLLSRLAVDGLAGQISWSSFVHSLTFGRPWSISWILLPTTAVLVLAPWLLKLKRAAGGVSVLAASVLLAWLVFGPLAGPLGAFSSWVEGRGIYLAAGQFVQLAVLGMLGLGAAVVVDRTNAARFAAWFAALGFVARVAVGDALPTVVDLSARFGVFLGVGLLLTMLPLAGVGQMLAMLGRNSLLVFLAHRLILQVQVHTVMGVLNPQVAGPLMTVITALLLLAACRIREATPALSTRLKRVGL